MGFLLLRQRQRHPRSPISQELSRRYFANEAPIGRQIHIGPPQFLEITPGPHVSDAKDVTIVGVIGDFKNVLRPSAEPHFSFCILNIRWLTTASRNFVRTAAEPRLLVSEITRQVHETDSDIPLTEAKPSPKLSKSKPGDQRFTTILLALFAVTGLALAVVGINWGTLLPRDAENWVTGSSPRSGCDSRQHSLARGETRGRHGPHRLLDRTLRCIPH